MAGSMEWLEDTLTDRQREERLALEEVLRDGQTLFRKLLVPGSIGPDDGINKLLNRFDATTLNSLITLYFDLHRALFEKPETVFNSGTTRPRYLIQMLPESRISELVQFTERIFNDDARDFPGDIVEILDFYMEWLKDAENAAVTPDIIDPSPSEISARKRWRDEIAAIATRFDEGLQAGKAADVAIAAAERATRAAEHAETASGETAQSALGNHFSRIADRERRWAFGWTVVTIAAVVAVVLIGLRIVSVAVSEEWQKTLFHLVLVLPILGLASYTATVAKTHRQLERWATTAYVQIRSVGAYSDLLPRSGGNREQLIMDLGQTIFGTPAFGEDPKGERISAVPADLLDALKDIAKALASRTSTPPGG